MLEHGANVRLVTLDTSESAYIIALNSGYKNIALMIANVAILQAMRANDSVTLMKMIQAGGSVNIINSAGWTPLMYLIKEGKYDFIKELIIKYSPNLNIIEKDGWTALMFACYYNYVDIVQLLIQYGADISYESPRTKHSAMAIATKRNFPHIIQTLNSYRPVRGLRAKMKPI